ncbi:MAG: motility protein A [Nitrospinae bacterium]|nr:motility protein A [Nitrospinota bacterium]
MSTLIAIITGVGLVLFAMNMGAGIENFWDLPAFMIVVGGTSAAMFICFPLPQIMRVFGVLRQIFLADDAGPGGIIALFVRLSFKARQQSLLSLEEDMKRIENRYIKQGLEMVIDGHPGHLIRDVLETELDFVQVRHRKGEHIFRTASKLAPAFGLMGTVIGLVQMLLGLADATAAGTNATEVLARGMAVALMTTFYGVLLSNLFFAPIAEKLHVKTDEEHLNTQVIIEGVLMLQSGVNPRIIERKLNSYLSPQQRVKVYDEYLRRQRTAAPQ